MAITDPTGIVDEGGVGFGSRKGFWQKNNAFQKFPDRNMQSKWMFLFLLQQSAHSHTRTHTDIQTHTHNNILPVVLKNLDIRTRKQFEELRILMVNDSVREVQMKLWYQCFRRESVGTVNKEKCEVCNQRKSAIDIARIRWRSLDSREFRKLFSYFKYLDCSPFRSLYSYLR